LRVYLRFTGYYLNELACADIAGAHFLGVHKQFEILDVAGVATADDDVYAFFDALPDIVVHPSPELDRLESASQSLI
jgi:hypothetical protein